MPIRKGGRTMSLPSAYTGAVQFVIQERMWWRMLSYISNTRLAQDRMSRAVPWSGPVSFELSLMLSEEKEGEEEEEEGEGE